MMGTAAHIIACHQAEDLTIRNGHVVNVNIHLDDNDNDDGAGAGYNNIRRINTLALFDIYMYPMCTIHMLNCFRC